MFDYVGPWRLLSGFRTLSIFLIEKKGYCRVLSILITVLRSDSGWGVRREEKGGRPAPWGRNEGVLEAVRSWILLFVCLFCFENFIHACIDLLSFLFNKRWIIHASCFSHLSINCGNSIKSPSIKLITLVAV